MFATTIIGLAASTFWIMFVLILSVFVALYPGMVAKGKGYSFWLFFLLSIPFWWITFFVVIFMKPRNNVAS